MSSDSETDIYKLLRRIAEEQNYESSDIKLAPLSSGGANYSSFLYTATITSKNKEDLHLFLKKLTVSKDLLDTKFSIVDKEKSFYTDIQNLYKNIEEKYQVPEEHRLNLPKYFGKEVSASNEILVLENIAVRGFESFDRFKSMDWAYASKAVTELAKLHALSVALPINHPEEFKSLSKTYLVDIFNKQIFDSVSRPGIQHTLSVLEGDKKIKLQKYIDKNDMYSAFMEGRNNAKLTVIAHGDFRPSNFMHRHSEDGSLELMVLDHQTMCLGSPIYDLLCLIVLASDKAFRDQYYDKLIDFYYMQLSDALKRLDIDPENIYSKEDYYAELKQKLQLGLIIGIFALHIITVETDSAPELVPEMSLDNFEVKKLGPLYADRMRDLIDDYIKWGVIN